MTERPASDDEPALQPLDPRVLTLWRVVGGLSLLAGAGAAVVVDLVVELPLPTGMLPGIVAVAGAAALIVVPRLRYARWRYALREEDLWIRRGILIVTTSVIPYERLQFVDTRQGPLERLLGLAELVVHTASPGTSGQLLGLDASVAEALRERLGAVRATSGGV